MTSKHQTTIPVHVRRALGLRSGDRVEFVIRGKTAVIRKAPRLVSEDVAFRMARTHAMRDWDTPEDDEAFRDL